MLQSIIEFFKSLFGLGEKIATNKAAKIPLQKEAIKERSDTKVIKQENKQDLIKDRHVRKSPKILYYFDGIDEYEKSIQMTGNQRPLYFGDKERILREIKQDMAQILTRPQQKQLRKMVEESDHAYYVVKLHPLTIHDSQ